jgi:hypothetical protein
MYAYKKVVFFVLKNSYYDAMGGGTAIYFKSKFYTDSYELLYIKNLYLTLVFGK